MTTIRRLPLAAQVGLLAIVYFVAAKLSLGLAIPPGYATAVWPPSGVAVAAVLMLGNRVWPGVWLGAAAVNFTINSSAFAAVAIGTGNTLEALAAAILIRRFVGVPYRFQRGEDVIIFMAAAIVAAAIAASVGVMPMALGSGLKLEELFTNVWTWWLGDVAGIIVFVPLILSWSGGDTPAWPPRQKIEAALFAVLLLVTAYLAFSGGARYAPPIPRSYLLVPFVLWVSFRFGQRETATAVATVCGIALWYTLAGRGPFATGALNSSLLLLLTYIIVLQGMGLVLCAVIGERSRAMAQVLKERDELESRVRARTLELEHINRVLNHDIIEREKAESRFKGLLESAPDAIVIVNGEGNIVLVNSQTEKQFGYRRMELIGQPVDILLPAALSRYRRYAPRTVFPRLENPPAGGGNGAARIAQERAGVSDRNQLEPARNRRGNTGLECDPRHHRAQAGRGNARAIGGHRRILAGRHPEPRSRGEGPVVECRRGTPVRLYGRRSHRQGPDDGAARAPA
jgi:integral membrane sensor domain MASE1